MKHFPVHSFTAHCVCMHTLIHQMQLQTCKYTVGVMSSSESVAAVGWANDRNPLLLRVQAL